MPIPESRLYRPDKINIWFAVSSVLMAAAIGWLVYVDYARPWHAYQDDYYVAKAAIAHLDYLDALKEENQQKIVEAKVRRDEAQEYLDSTASQQLTELGDKLVEAKLEFKKANAHYSATSQVLDVTRAGYEAILAEYGEHHEITKKSHEQVRHEEDMVVGYQQDKELWEDAVDDIEDQIKGLREELTTVEKQLRDLETIAAEALQKDQQYRGVLSDEGMLGGIPIVSSVINAPLLDFISPKNTPARYQVNQLVLPEIRQQLNYLETYTTDRCTTCHVSIADPDFSKSNLARKLEQSLPGVMEAMQRDGQNAPSYPAPPELASGATIPTGQVTEHWGELSTQQQDEYFEALLAIVNDYFTATGRKTIELGQPLLAHPDLELYVSVDSPHGMAKMGCTICHEGNPQETDFIFAAHSPPTHEIEEEWADAYYDHNMGVPTATFELISHYWDRPMLMPRHSEAGCAKCHYQISDISRHHENRVGTTINRGQELFTSVGCVNCHVEGSMKDARRVGPDLSHIASKLKRDFVEPWVMFPQKFRPSTRMPHFFLQENNREGSENQFDLKPVLRTETEVAAITQYLFAVSSEVELLEKPAGLEGDAESGRTLFKSLGCLACHGNIAEFGEAWITTDLQHKDNLDEKTAGFRYKGMTDIERVKYAMENFGLEADAVFDPESVRFEPDQAYKPPTFSRFAPELSDIGSKVTAEWLYSWLMNPTHFSPDTKMPNMRLSSEDATDIAAYLMTLQSGSFKQDQFDMNEDRLAMADDLIFTLLTAQRSERRSRAIMQDEGHELADTLVSLLSSSPTIDKQQAYDLVSAMSLQDKKLTFLGNKMIGHYGCYACHNIAGFEKTTPPGTELTIWAEKPISQLDFAFYDHAFHHMREEKEETFGHLYPKGSESDPEDLNYWSPGKNPGEQVTHTHSAFAKHKLRNPRLWDREKIKKPYDKLKMPNFYLTDMESEALTTFLLSRRPALVGDSLQIDYENNGMGAIARGRNLTRELNCVACHQIEDNAPIIQQYFSQDISGITVFNAVNAPPLLWGEGAKIQHHWLDKFFQNVETLRPWLQVRMPSFTLTEDQSATLVEYFAALSQRDSHHLDSMTKPVVEYMVKSAEKQSTNDDLAEGEEAGSNWYAQESLASNATNLRNWSKERKLIRPSEIDLLRRSPKQLRESHKKLLGRIDFLTKLYDVQYPFVQPTQSLSSNDRYDKGGKFFADMGCLQCHIFGDMLPSPAKTTDEFVNVYRLDGVRGEGDTAKAIINGKPYKIGSVIDGHTLISAENIFYETGDVDTNASFTGPNAAGETETIMLVAASAPNLALTHQRLRRDWVVSWMLDPQVIQPGTKMPQNFPGGVSPFAGSEEYPGDAMDHINLLVDYLYDAGIKGARSPLIKIVLEEDDGEGFDEDEDFDD